MVKYICHILVLICCLTYILQGGCIMTEKFLREALEIGHENGQDCILVWANLYEFDTNSIKLDSFTFLKNQEYEMVFGRPARMNIKCITDFVSSNKGWFMSIPVKKFENPRYFYYILQILQREEYHGPISFLPSKKTLFNS